jgi:hypothetical protein
MKYEDFLFVGLQLQKQDKVIDKLNEIKHGYNGFS